MRRPIGDALTSYIHIYVRWSQLILIEGSTCFHKNIASTFGLPVATHGYYASITKYGNAILYCNINQRKIKDMLITMCLIYPKIMIPHTQVDEPNSAFFTQLSGSSELQHRLDAFQC
jgi:hypothetical protein